MVTIAQQAAFRGEKIFAPAGLIVFLMGIAMMLNINWGWGTFWIDAGLVGYVVTFVTGIGVLSPLAKKIEASAQAERAGTPRDDRPDRPHPPDRPFRRGLAAGL